ncbi:hypothetical protein GCM10011492_35370 [Flexivirga endophytica]|uniref:Uncharacterized protein n=1 Tax=Flexivirga endophytica TaxID=1849103 RepID=A0A916WXE6_9MICO|nr:hypothetical protein [Flexivirga endophytica]GGB41377.1 hypothetical protein GCM10011492_35370 [Flexivirga endophytica]GHB49216.1 hypothetical protein GCM10008112_17750 [Flexivirga endophytica]
MSFLKRAKPQLPPQVLEQLDLPKGERVLASAIDKLTGAHIVATNWHLTVVSPDGQVTARPWHEVDAGQWESQTWSLTVTWIDRKRPGQWTFGEQDTRLPETFHERVRASIVLAEELPLEGRGSGRVVIRRDLQHDTLLTQTVLGRGARADDPQVQDAVARTRAFVEDAVGLR